jgi:hypothetical protein
MRKAETFIPASPDLQQRWKDMRWAISEVARSFTGMAEFALAPHRVLELPGAQAEMQGIIVARCKGGKANDHDVAGDRCYPAIGDGGVIGFRFVEWRRDSSNRPGVAA